MKCLNCEVEISGIPGKREKKFCSGNCRAKYGQRSKREREFEARIQKIVDTPEFQETAKKVRDRAMENWVGEAKVIPVKVSVEHSLTVDAKILAINNETKPEYIKTALGEKAWRNDQKKRIEELKRSLM